MIFNKLLERKMVRTYMKYLEKHGSDIFNYEQREKIVKKIIKAINLTVLIGTSLFLMYFFTTIIYNKLGFERTIIIILTIIVILINQNK